MCEIHYSMLIIASVLQHLESPSTIIMASHYHTPTHSRGETHHIRVDWLIRPLCMKMVSFSSHALLLMLPPPPTHTLLHHTQLCDDDPLYANHFSALHLRSRSCCMHLLHDMNVKCIHYELNNINTTI